MRPETIKELAQKTFELLDKKSCLTSIRDLRISRHRYSDEFSEWELFGDLHDVTFEGHIDLIEIVELICEEIENG